MKRILVADKFSWQKPVLDILSTPPGSPSKGDRYIVGGSATGAWENEDDNVAEYDGATWIFDEPSSGWFVVNLDDDKLYKFTTEWQEFESGGGGGGDVIPPSFFTTVPSNNIVELDDLASGWSDEYSNGTVGHTTTEQIEGAGAIKITVSSDGLAAGMSLSVTKDYSQSDFRLWVKSDDWDNVGSANIIFETSSGNLYSMHLKTYFQDLKDDEWYDISFSRKQFAVFGSPDWGNITKIILRGWTDTAGTPTIWFDGLAEYPQAKRGIVSLCFDDGWDSQYTTGLPILEKYNYQGTNFVIPSLLGDTNYQTEAQVEEFHKKGWDIAGHNATDLTTLDAEVVEQGVRGSSEYLRNKGFRGANIYAYPNGQNNEQVREIVRKYFPVARTINWSNQPLGYINPLRINAFSPINTTTVSVIKDRIDDAVNNGNWLILIFHRIVTSPSIGTEYSTANFEEIIDYLYDQGVEVQPISRVLARNDFHLDTGGGGGGSPLDLLSPTGDVDDSNLEFTFSEEPLMININGALYPKETGIYNWTWSAGTATLAVPVGTGGFIVGVK